MRVVAKMSHHGDEWGVQRGSKLARSRHVSAAGHCRCARGAEGSRQLNLDDVP